MITNERIFELMKEAGLDEKKFAGLLAKEEPNLFELKESELDQVTGGKGVIYGFDKILEKLFGIKS